MKDHQEKVEFKLPKAFSIPEGTEVGGTFSVVCDFELKESGQACLAKIGEADMPGYGSDEKSEEHKPSYRDYSERMSGGQAPVNAASGEGGGAY